MKTVTKVFIIIAICFIVVGSMIFSIAGAAFDFDFTQIGSENANYQLVTKDYSVSEFEEMNLTAKNLNLKFAKSADEKIHLKFYESDNFDNNFVQSKNTISFNRKSKTWFNFGFGSGKDVALVELPSGYDPKMMLEIKNGGLAIDGLKFSKQFKIDVNNGAFKMTDSTFNGNVDFTFDNAANEISNSAFGGDVTFKYNNSVNLFDDVTFAKTTKIDSDNGTFSFDVVSFATFGMKSSNGTIKFENVTGDDFNFNLSNSNLRGEIDAKETDYTIMVSEENGSSNLKNQTATTGTKKFVADIENGSINVRFTR